ncbi:hypothetical protein Sme01_09510 [Sphaerisporangium melleum]|uniref:Uncharacterized protein n=1 Tax=Sphaerisporangium melleum TaxID=321316 RepID=A0A917QTD8_9ACTN|nr:hypothetical protein GCM10007964_08100 [Sphaerisporangium melleum]GII68475.1 hypothetical protein Sme01_09510 [Sphaerisporangium melleum]
MLATGTSCFAEVWVSGRNLVPRPPASTSAFMQRVLSAGHDPAVAGQAGHGPRRGWIGGPFPLAFRRRARETLTHPAGAAVTPPVNAPYE